MAYQPGIDLHTIEQEVLAISDKAAAFIREQAQKISAEDVEIKGSHDYVTYVDKTSEKMLVEGLKRILPQAGFIAEEGTEKQEGERYNWIVDPLDGTTNFIHGIPFYCISIALQDKLARELPPNPYADGQQEPGNPNSSEQDSSEPNSPEQNLPEKNPSPSDSPAKEAGNLPSITSKAIPEGEIILGLVHHISMDEKFHAIWGEPARLNGKPIRTSPMQDLDTSLIVTGFPYYDFERLDGYMQLLQESMRSTAGLRRLGSAALDLAAVAAGRSEAFFEYGLKPWDVAAGQFLVKQAGGKVCDFAGGNHYLHGREIVCGNPGILPKFLKMLQKFVPSHFLPTLCLCLSFLLPLNAAQAMECGFQAFETESSTEIRNENESGILYDTLAEAPTTEISTTEAPTAGSPVTEPLATETSSSGNSSAKASQETLYRFVLDDDIGPAAARIVTKALQEAEEAKASRIFFELNTFGGTLKEADEIRTLLLECPIPTLVYININAASAGALISIACDSIYMNPAGSIGAATVVDANGEIQADKYQSYMRAMMRATAEATGRNPRIAEAMVDERIHVPGISDSGKVLTFTAKEALQHQYCQGIYPDAESTLQALGLDQAPQIRQELKASDKIINFLVNPFVSGILIMMIIGGIYFELQTPGIGFALAISILGCLLYFAPHYMEGLASHWEILIFLIGIVLIIVEIFVTPGFGVAGISGIFLVCAGLTLALIDNWGLHFRFVNPMKFLEAAAVVVVSTVLTLIIGYKLSLRLFGRRVRGHALALDSEQKREEGYVSVSNLSSYQALVGNEAVAESVLRPSGKIRIGTDLYDATSEAGYVERGQRVRIMRFENAQFFVRKLSTDPAENNTNK